MTVTLWAFLASLVLAALLTPVAMRVARRLGILDRPDRKLKRHRAPVPYLGGAAIFVACVAAVIGTKLATTGSPRGVIGMLAGAAVVFVVGLYDDVRPLRPRSKLAFQVAAALIPVALGVHIKFIANPWVAIPLTVLWIVGITNAFNLLDIMDGLCAGVAVIAAAVFWVISEQNGRANDAIAAAGLAGGVLAFLWYNRPPARIFMGDAGSMFIGFLLATVAIGEGYSKNTNLGVISPLLILSVPIFETLFVMAVRWQQGKPVLQGSPDHVALRMLKLGYGRAKVLGVLCGTGALGGALAYAVIHMNWERAVLVSVVVVIAALMSAIKLAAVDMGGR